MSTLDKLAHDLANKVDWLFQHIERERINVTMDTAEKLIEVRDAGAAWKAEFYRVEEEARKSTQAECEHDWKRTECSIPPYDICTKCHLTRSTWKPDPLRSAINGRAEP